MVGISLHCIDISASSTKKKSVTIKRTKQYWNAFSRTYNILPTFRSWTLRTMNVCVHNHTHIYIRLCKGVCNPLSILCSAIAQESCCSPQHARCCWKRRSSLKHETSNLNRNLCSSWRPTFNLRRYFVWNPSIHLRSLIIIFGSSGFKEPVETQVQYCLSLQHNFH